MKVTCRNCGKRFDYDTYTGLCPKCSTYYHIDTPASDSYDTDSEYASDTYPDYHTEAADTSYAAQEPVSTEESRIPSQHDFGKPQHTGFRNNRKLTIALIIAMVLIFVVPYCSIQYVIQRKEQDYSLTDIIKPAPISIGDTITFNTENTQYDLTITNASQITDTCYQVPDGYQLIAFHYSLIEPSATEDSDSNNRPYTPLAGDHFIPYLYTQSGQYLQAISEYDIADANGSKDYQWLHTTGTSSEFEYTEGSVYFLVKTDDIANLLIQHLNTDTDQIVASYQIDNVEVTE